MKRRALYLLCFASGVAGLTYEVIWLRVLAVLVGNASFAAAAVLAAVMGGIGLGAFYGGRLADRHDPLVLYGLLELGLGLLAFAVPSFASLLGDAALPLLRLAGVGVVATLLRFLIAASVVLLPSVLMGATLPALVRFAELDAARGGRVVGARTGTLYALNTAGAALGAVLTGYVLLGRYGVAATSAAAACLDVVVGLAALLLAYGSRRAAVAPDAAPDIEESLEPGPSPLPYGPRVALVIAFVTGACALGLEGLWSRLFTLVFGHDVHAFAAMLSSMLAGIALGAAAYRAAPARLRARAFVVPTLLAAVGALALLSHGVVGRLYLSHGVDVLGLASRLSIARSHVEGVVVQAVFAALCIVPAAMASGALLPALVAVHRADAGAGRRVGEVFAANTLGSIVGVLFVPLVLVRALGLQGSLVAVAALALSSAVALAARSAASPRRRGLAVIGLVAGVLLALLAVPGQLHQRALAHKMGGRHLDFALYHEGPTGTVAVVENRINQERQLLVNGINEVTTRFIHDQSFKLLGHLGLLLHPEPARVVVVCLGAGISGGAAALHRPQSLEVVDLQPAVVHAARHFTDLNNELLDDPLLDLVFTDGRHHLRTTEDAYDVIVLDSTHPRAVDSWMLYTREFYATARAALAADGFLVQWVPLHGMTVDELGIIARTFVEVFPEGSLWINSGFEPYGQSGYALLVGRPDPAPFDPAVIARRLEVPGVRADLAPWGLASPAEVLECFVAGGEAIRRWTAGLPINTDDLPYTQYITRFSEAAPMDSARLLEVREPITDYLSASTEPALIADLARRYEAHGHLLAGRLEAAAATCGPGCAKPGLSQREVRVGRPYYLALRELYPSEPERLLEVAAGLAELGHLEDARQTLETGARARPDSARLWLHLGLLRAAGGEHGRAAEAYRRALTLDDGLLLARVDLGLALVAQGQVDAGLAQLRIAETWGDELAPVQAALGHALLAVDDGGGQAAAHLRRALELDPRHAGARVELGRLQLAQGRGAAAVATFEAGRHYHPYDTDLLYSLGVARLRAGHDGAAREAFAAALAVDPQDEEAAAALATLAAPPSPMDEADPRQSL